MKIKKLFLGAFTTALSFGLVYSAGLAGTCGDGPTPCTLNDLGPVIKGALKFLMLLAGLAITLAFIQTGIAFLRASDKSQAWKEAKERLTRVVIGMLLITVAVSITGYIAQL
jgi:cytochrome bd-type quinol oxidase subunit 2